ncbi:RNA polymerase sigma-70 factor (ECF subfamily) [Caldalkalibacillus uzonensis]|uniref:RNA polymerase sigma-70 factor (ECF subfamily) n=1 Tax=Caldalkalibacillus uzonensis TaxID=353224 RepID=A0ABU0CPM6_9BACI|nr:RNA polymerase sigma factor [Caldalkalibacillus uzonensis]MDQ0338351.1 RNA polymerase sigma-70 factor (ECF subfamily) [Caldalkalibacillus uzonensis]
MDNYFRQLEKFYEQYQPEIYAYLYHQTGRKEIAEELCQDVFLKAYHGLPSYRGQASIKSWLYRIAHNHFVTWYRRETRYRMVPIKTELLHQLEADHDLPHKSLEQKEESEHVRRILNQLKTEFRTVLILRDIQELAYQEIADILGWSLPKVKTTLHRARLQFRLDFEKYEQGQVVNQRRKG